MLMALAHHVYTCAVVLAPLRLFSFSPLSSHCFELSHQTCVQCVHELYRHRYDDASFSPLIVGLGTIKSAVKLNCTGADFVWPDDDDC
jgi:hypothetical protein